MVIDAHAHFEPGILDLDHLISRMDEVGIDKTALISRVTDLPLYKKSDLLMAVQRRIMRSSRLRPIAEFVDASFHRKGGKWHPWYSRIRRHRTTFQILADPDNQSVVNTIQKYPERLLGWIFLNPMRPAWKEELRRLRDTPQMVGIKVHPFWHRYPLARAEEVAQEAEQYRLPLLVHLGFEKAIAVKELCARFPELPIIFAHAGVPLYQDLWQVIQHLPNTYIDLSSHHVDEGIVRDAVSTLKPERCIFGSDDPYGGPRVSSTIKSWIEKLPISVPEKAGILGENFVRLINIRGLK